MNLIVTILEQGLIYGILSLGLYITYKILDFPDLTVDGSFPLGAAVTAALHYKSQPIHYPDASGGICSRCAGRDLYRAYPCKMQST